MLISLSWIRDYVELPVDLHPRDLAERFTCTTAEVDGVSPVAIAAKGLIAAGVVAVADLPDQRNARLATLDIGDGKTADTVTSAPVLHTGDCVVYAPCGASVAKLGEITESRVAGRASLGMILPGDVLGVEMAPFEAIFLGEEFQPGTPLPAELFEDDVIDIDNKSITHRPDLWGHYGIAREIAAIYGQPLQPFPVVPIAELNPGGLAKVPISIADFGACRRYSGLVLAGVPKQPAPLWMQLRLGHVGMRPISGLVDLTNYVMADLGQPMHAFDAKKVDRIEVDWARDGDRFTTLDGLGRTLTSADLMIQSQGRSVALAGVMGGLETEVTPETSELLLESANFDPSTIRRTATRLGLRTDASARFEKSLDPGYTVLGIQRFIQLARAMYPNMRLAGQLSDAYLQTHESITVYVNPAHVDRMIGRSLPVDEIQEILEPLGFEVDFRHDELAVTVPSYRATNDISIEADIIEEIARYVGYNNIVPAMPRVTMRQFQPNALHELEQRSLEYFTSVHSFNEIHGYLWYDSPWLAQLGVEAGSCVELRNPASDGLHRLRRSLMPGMLRAVVKNRFHFPAFALVELGSVFDRGEQEDGERRHLGLVSARRGKRIENELYQELKDALAGWAWQRFARTVDFVGTAAAAPWEHPQRTAELQIAHVGAGRISVIPLALRKMMDEHLGAWSIAWAQLDLTGLSAMDRRVETLGKIPEYPLVEMDFSLLVPLSNSYAAVADQLIAFAHPLLKQIRFVTKYEGDAIAKDTRSLTFRAVVGHDERTLVEQDAVNFRQAFEAHAKNCGYQVRT
jgi:phenylalanyl-tRNA synthetase beta chain